MEELNNWDYAIENNRKKKRKEAQEFLDKVGYDFDENKLNLRDSLAYDFVKEEVDELVREHDKAMNTIRQLNTPYNDVRDMNGSYKTAENVGRQRRDKDYSSHSEAKYNLSYENFDTRTNEILQNIGNHLMSANAEDMKDYIYLDTKGKKTTGVGDNIDNYDDFMKIDWIINERLATKKEKEESFNEFEKMKKRGEYGYKAKYYEELCNLRVSNEYEINRMREHLIKDIKALQSGIEDFNDFPEPLKEVLVDFRYNTGNITIGNHPNLRKAIDKKDLSLIERWIMRPEIQKKRREWILEKLRSIPEGNGWHRSKK